MLHPKFLSVFGALTIGMIALAFGASPSKAILFGDQFPSGPGNGGCASTADPTTPRGVVCNAMVIFTEDALTVQATGYTGAPLTSPTTSLTLKGPIFPGCPTPQPGRPPGCNDFPQTGLGTNADAGPKCTNPNCEIDPLNSVAVTAGAGTLITNARIGSVQPGETFNFFVELAAGGPFTQLDGTIGSTCVGDGFVSGQGVCEWQSPMGQRTFGIAVQTVTGDVVLTSATLTVAPVPEPASLLLLGAGLLGLGMLRYPRKRVN